MKKKVSQHLPISDTVLRGLLLNAFQLGSLLSKTMPEVTKYIQEPMGHVDCSEDLGCYYAQAIELHQKYLTDPQQEQLGNIAGELYCKVIM
jgi:hypothetical protein